MTDPNTDPIPQEEPVQGPAGEPKPQDSGQKYRLHIILFLVTLATTTACGYWWMFGSFAGFGEMTLGLYFSIPFLAILTIHEFGHYLTARYYNVKTTLPYYIPFLPLPFSIGTLGAVIRIKETIRTSTQNYDIGIAGPLAGFVAALFVIWYGFATLPPVEHIYEIHPEYEYFGKDYEKYVYDYDTTILKSDLEKISDHPLIDSYPDTIRFTKGGPSMMLGHNLTFWFFENYIVTDKERLPSHYEMMHNPWLMAGFLALFFTALNLIPIGQLDGGHVIYGLFGVKRHAMISSVVFVLFVLYAGVGVINPRTQDFSAELSFSNLLISVPVYIYFLYLIFSRLRLKRTDKVLVAVLVFAVQYVIVLVFPDTRGFPGWLLLAFLIGRLMGIYHPPSLIEEPLDKNRQILGWIALFIFIISFSPRPIIMEGF